MVETYLRLDDVSVSFPIYQSGSRSLKKRILFRSSGGQIGTDAHDRITVEALRSVSISLKAGDRVALVGSNGAGKTTLLRVMAHIYEPTMGSVSSGGRISPMFDVGLGIDSELNGYDNIRLRGLILGMSSDEIAARMDDVAAFTELGDYLSLPVRTYSSGMLTRLTFAVATCFSPEILLMDEWIVAGDAAFMAKANKRITDFVTNARILVLASHSEEICRTWCDTAIWMEQGRVRSVGPVDTILQQYSGK